MWSAPTNVTAGAGQIATGTSISVSKGSTLRVRLNDPTQQFLKGTPPLLIGVGDPSSSFHPMRQIASDATGTTFEIAVPVGKSLQLEISAAGIEFTNAAGVALGSAPAGIPIPPASGQDTTTLTFTVAAKK